ncbi:MAG: 1,4-alpha-glucan branching protein GlgB [Phycisphaerae bacterium]|jgi:1,4-alpha-glucan branching enzyme
MDSKVNTRSKREAHDPIAGEPQDRRRLAAGEHSEPHRYLGAHPLTLDGVAGAVIRAFHPDAVSAECILPGGAAHPLKSVGHGAFAGFVAGMEVPAPYRVRFHFPSGADWVRDDPYRFLPTLGDWDLHLFNEGTHRQLWRHLGAHPRTVDGVEGVSFAVWAPNAARVSVVGDPCNWDGRIYPMRQMGSSGVFEIFVPGFPAGALYKYEIKTPGGEIRLKADPLGTYMEHPPGTASRVYASRYTWGDAEWMEQRATRDWQRSPMAIYEVHLGSWRWTEDGSRPLSYRELAAPLVEHVKRFGFTHIEPLPVMEHPFGQSWGYQVSGYYAPTARFGEPDDFRYFVDYCHRHGVGVIVDWVPAHFPKDDFALRRFDGTALYEHDDPRRGEHPDWGTLIFNYDRNEVRNFLIANALYWLQEFHIDGLRVDAVASILYLDYSRKPGEWVPNKYGGRENLEGISFLQQLNETVRQEVPGALMVAEESTAWGGVTRPAPEGGLGFAFKWNMGWMHDTLLYFSKEPVHRKYHHHDLTFAMIYEYSERFIMPLSHDEVVHGKRPLLEKMPGDLWQKFANLRALLAYQYTRPGKKLLFMGTELAPWYEWWCEAGLDWSLSQHPERAALQRFLEDLGRLYLDTPALWRNDPDPHGYCWIDCHDCDNSVYSFFRRDGDQYLIVAMNMTPVPRESYRIGVPVEGRYVLRLNSDDLRYGGSSYPLRVEPHAEPTPWHNQPHSLNLALPPLGVVVYQPAP